MCSSDLQGVGDGVDVRADGETMHHEVIAHIHDRRKCAVIVTSSESPQKASSSHTTTQNGNHSVTLGEHREARFRRPGTDRQSAKLRLLCVVEVSAVIRPPVPSEFLYSIETC